MIKSCFGRAQVLFVYCFNIRMAFLLLTLRSHFFGEELQALNGLFDSFALLDRK